MNGAENAIPMRSTSSRLGLFAALAVVGCASLAGTDGRLAVRVFFLASSADSLAVERAATDLGLEVPYASLSAERAATLFRTTGMGTPMFALMRHGRIVAMVGNVGADYALDIIDGILR